MLDIGSESDYYVESSGEETIAGVDYHKFIDPFYQTSIFLREDIGAKKVYKVFNGLDVLLFDFNLHVGDQITLANQETYQVISETEIPVTGGERRQLVLNCLTNSNLFNEVWIEGVGNREHPLMARFEYDSDPTFNLNCSYQNSINIYNRGLFIGQPLVDCSELLNSTDILSQGQIQVYQYESSKILNVKSEFDLSNYKMSIINILGQELLEKRTLHGKTLNVDVSHIQSGLYLLHLSGQYEHFNQKIYIK